MSNPNFIYTNHGYESRAHYLESLAADYGVDLDSVQALASLLGPDEDFDGLVAELEDFSDFIL